MPEVFAYTDYRKFLQDYYEEEKEKNPGVSYRYLAEKVGFKSAGHFTKIIQGKVNISITLALKFAEFLGLSKKKTEYFQYLVLFNQAKNHQDKRTYFEKIKSFKESGIMKVDTTQYEFYNKWYYTVIRELLAFHPFKDDYKELASLVLPAITPSEAKKAIVLLEKLNLIQKGENGYYKQTDALIKADKAVKSVMLNNFVLKMLSLAGKTIDDVSPDERMLSATTISVSQKTFKSIQEELREFRKRILFLAKGDDAPERSYQFNFQVFPVSQRRKKNGNG